MLKSNVAEWPRRGNFAKERMPRKSRKELNCQRNEEEAQFGRAWFARKFVVRSMALRAACRGEGEVVET